MALPCCCLGLRISECLGLRWLHVDRLNGKPLLERGIVCQQVDDVKTSESRKLLVVAGELLTALQTWKQASQFSGPDDWMFASSVQLDVFLGLMTTCGASTRKQRRHRASARNAMPLLRMIRVPLVPGIATRPDDRKAPGALL